MTQSAIQISIDLPNFKVNRVEETEHEINIYGETTEGFGRCHSCQKKITKRHARDRERRLRHLPILGKPTYIIYHAHRYFCEDYSGPQFLDSSVN